MTDLETRLSQALHTLTPEPPTSFRFTPVPEVEPDGADVVVPIVRDAVSTRRRPRVGAWLAAAAVVVLGAGVAVAAVSAHRSDTAPALIPAPSSVPDCPFDDIVVSQQEHAPGADGFHVDLALENAGVVTCRLRPLPRATLLDGNSPAGRNVSPFPLATVMPQDLVLRPGDRFVLDAQMGTVGECRFDGKAGAGLKVELGNGTVLGAQFHNAGCDLVALGLSARAER